MMDDMMEEVDVDAFLPGAVREESGGETNALEIESETNKQTNKQSEVQQADNTSTTTPAPAQTKESEKEGKALFKQLREAKSSIVEARELETEAAAEEANSIEYVKNTRFMCFVAVHLVLMLLFLVFTKEWSYLIIGLHPLVWIVTFAVGYYEVSKQDAGYWETKDRIRVISPSIIGSMHAVVPADTLHTSSSVLDRIHRIGATGMGLYEEVCQRRVPTYVATYFFISGVALWVLMALLFAENMTRPMIDCPCLEEPRGDDGRTTFVVAELCRYEYIGQRMTNPITLEKCRVTAREYYLPMISLYSDFHSSFTNAILTPYITWLIALALTAVNVTWDIKGTSLVSVLNQRQKLNAEFPGLEMVEQFKKEELSAAIDMARSEHGKEGLGYAVFFALFVAVYVPVWEWFGNLANRHKLSQDEKDDIIMEPVLIAGWVLGFFVYFFVAKTYTFLMMGISKRVLQNTTLAKLLSKFAKRVKTRHEALYWFRVRDFYVTRLFEINYSLSQWGVGMCILTIMSCSIALIASSIIAPGRWLLWLAVQMEAILSVLQMLIVVKILQEHLTVFSAQQSHEKDLITRKLTTMSRLTTEDDAEEAEKLYGVLNETKEYIAAYDSPPKALGVPITPSIFTALKGYGLAVAGYIASQVLFEV